MREECHNHLTAKPATPNPTGIPTARPTINAVSVLAVEVGGAGGAGAGGNGVAVITKV